MSVPGLPVDVVVVGGGARLLHPPRHVVALLAAPPPEQPAEVGARPLLAHGGVSAGNTALLSYLISRAANIVSRNFLRQILFVITNVVDSSAYQLP